MTTEIALLGTKTWVCTAALAASVLLAGSVQANNTFPITVQVNTPSLNLQQEANVFRVGLQPVADYTDCYEQALGAAVQSVNQPRVTQV